MSNNINALRDALFSTLAKLQCKKDPMDIARASAICEVAREITSTARVEIDFMKVTGDQSDSGFISVAAPAPVGKPDNETANGIRDIKSVPGGTVTTHRMR